MDVSQRIAAARDALTKAERRVAEVVLQKPQAVAFGTVAELAKQSGSGAATVVRLAVKLGYDGFTGLQDAVQGELEGRLRPAVERIRRPVHHDLIEAALTRELGNVHETLESLDRSTFDSACAILADPAREVLVISGDATGGVALQAVTMLGALRLGVSLLTGNPVAVATRLAGLRPGDVVVAIDLRRYEAWAVAAATDAAARGAEVVAVTDSQLSPLASLGERCFVVAAEGAGPFDSHIGTLALLNALVAGTAERLQDRATVRLDAIEAAWRDSGALLDR
jgi:DNA-binding MurR/RpiR family transcriptional regulator